MAPNTTSPVIPSSSSHGLTKRRPESRGSEADQQPRKEHANPPEFTADAVALHNQPTDCWMIIDQNVYDVTSWVPKHPGGAMIYVHAGHDCTQMFESYHPLYVRKMLARFLVGRLASPRPQGEGKSPGSLQPLSFSPETGFYATLKQRVEAYFKDRKVNPRIHPLMYAKTAFILLGYAATFYGAYLAPWGMLYATASALLLGIFTGEIGVSIQHDCNHGAFSASPLLGYILGLSLDFVGASSFMWKQQHVVGHHVNTNVTHHDPDIRVNDPDVRRVTVQQPRRWYHAYQHVYLMVLYGLLSIKSILVDDFSAYGSGSIGPVKLAKMTQEEELIFWGAKMLYFAYALGLPYAFGNRSLLQFALLFALAQFVTGWMLAFMFQVAHVVPEAQFPVSSPDASTGRPSVALSWAAMQAATSTNFSPGNVLWNHFSGGLSHQIEHHLFPGVCHVYYPDIHPIVESTCKEFGVPYHSYSSYWEALRAHLRHLQNVGVADVLSQPLG